MTHIGLFEGIGGFSLAARWMGWETIAWCEWNPFCQTVLKYHFPAADEYGDITKTNFTKYANKVDILTGGFPCQPYSLSGKRLGKEDDRHLWPEMLRAIREIKPTWVVGENVFGIINWNGGLVFNEVQADLEAEGYEVQAFVLPACSVDAPHRRDRVWFVAYAIGSTFGNKSRKTNNEGRTSSGSREESIRQTHGSTLPSGINPANSYATTNPSSSNKRSSREGNCIERDWCNINSQPSERVGATKFDYGFANVSWNYSDSDSPRLSDWSKFPTKSPICSGDDGIPSRLDGITISKHRNESIKAYGNAIVPQVAYQIFMAIDQYNKL